MYWIWDYADNTLKVGRFAYTIARTITDFQNNPEYTFDEVPMPYDITIRAVKAGTKEVKYTITAARSNTPVPAAALEALKSAHPISEVCNDWKERQEKQLAAIAPAAIPDSEEISAEELASQL